MPNPPVVLCFSGHDPSGGAGIQADIETLLQHRCHAATVITALTQQDTRNVYEVAPQPGAQFCRQARTILADLPIAAIKMGLLGSAELARACADLIRSNPGIPVVLDPVLAAGGGTELAGCALVEVIRSELLPLVSVLTPNSPEARRLSGKQDLQDCALQLLRWGCRSVLITGSHEDEARVVNRLWLYGATHPQSWDWDRLPYSYHGSGCTLAAAVAAGLAHGWSIEAAVHSAQAYTWRALASGNQLGNGQHLPNRVVEVSDKAV